ncbi:MAG: M15 family metallopeptidase [Deinococcus sp.]
MRSRFGRRGAALALLLSPSLAAATPVPAGRLLAAYPRFLARLDGGRLVWRDGTRMPLSGGRPLTSPAGRLDHPDLRELLRQPYPACAPLRPPAFLSDPGRARPTVFFGKMYGATPAEVQAHLVTVDWFGQRLPFSSVNGADRALEGVEHELAAQPGLRKYLVPSAGSFLWRTVAGSGRRSAHSWGIAIDLNARYSTYWAWEGHREFQPGIPYRNRLPEAIVWAFERHGFVWGGRWYHRDTMHFEYRPELSGG